MKENQGVKESGWFSLKEIVAELHTGRKSSVSFLGVPVHLPGLRHWSHKLDRCFISECNVILMSTVMRFLHLRP